MTRDEIMTMQPGRELDALVAEKVMGFTEMEFGRNDPNALFVYHPWKRRFQPSTDISAAWEVVEKNNKTHHRMFVLEVGGLLNPESIWRCTIGNVVAESTRSPEAIVKAALLAVMEGVNA